MAKRISKRVREEAAAICAQMACLRAAPNSYQYPPGQAYIVPASLDEGHKPSALAWDAYDAAPVDRSVPVGERLAINWAEAESMLRTGWEP